MTAYLRHMLQNILVLIQNTNRKKLFQAKPEKEERRAKRMNEHKEERHHQSGCEHVNPFIYSYQKHSGQRQHIKLH